MSPHAIAAALGTPVLVTLPEACASAGSPARYTVTDARWQQLVLRSEVPCLRGPDPSSGVLCLVTSVDARGDYSSCPPWSSPRAPRCWS
jgi:hypothetical protein